MQKNNVHFLSTYSQLMGIVLLNIATLLIVQTVQINESVPLWWGKSATPPVDEPICGFTGDRCQGRSNGINNMKETSICEVLI